MTSNGASAIIRLLPIGLLACYILFPESRGSDYVHGLQACFQQYCQPVANRR